MEKYANYTGILAILLMLAALIIILVGIDFNGASLITAGGLVMTLAFTPLFFIGHKQKYDAYKVPCYITSSIVTALLILGSVLAGNSDAFGQPNFYSGGFLALCYMVALLLFKPSGNQKTITVIFSIVLIGALLAKHVLEGRL
jgi:hypothetical protein